MYEATAVVTDADGNVTDRVSEALGLRWFGVDADNGFMLNGRNYPLRGVCRHQDRAERGNALLPEHHREDAEIISEIGATGVRLAHYPQAEEFYGLMDRYGIVVWYEIPFVGPRRISGPRIYGLAGVSRQRSPAACGDDKTALQSSVDMLLGSFQRAEDSW